MLPLRIVGIVDLPVELLRELLFSLDKMILAEARRRVVESPQTRVVHPDEVMPRETQELPVGLLHVELRHALGAQAFGSFGILTIEELLIFLEIFGSKAARKNKRQDECYPKTPIFLPYDL